MGYFRFQVLVPLAFLACAKNPAIQNPNDANNAHVQRASEFLSTGQWANYGGDPGGMRFSGLDQINTDNVARLEVAWTYRTGELDLYENTNLASKSAFEATPLMVNGVLYFSTPTNRVIAVNASNGEEIWKFDPKMDLRTGYSEVTS
ncbi:MAG: membrane-bound PQQ-dependent dehydrogenase, glucose/quinate/shikimate family, partial [Proteobacteria bacterium]|nr:membrane-bound PQQ-dependent dehydrogenase, glucose/quinate/shikimate family [Pseudomonadota bacterium]